MCFRLIFGRWRDRSVIISESIDDSDMSASENQVVVIKQVVEDQEAMRVRAVMGVVEVRHLGTLLYASLNDVIHTTAEVRKDASAYWHYYTIQHILMCGVH